MIFRRARLRLTVLIGAVQIALFVAFAIAIYVYVSTAFDYDPADAEATVSAEAAFAILRQGLSVGIAIVVVALPATSYLIAGAVLRPAAQAYDAQQRFVDDAAHELRTPLAAVQLNLDLALARDRSASEHRALVDQARESTGRLGDTIAQLLWLARAERGALQRERVDVASLVGAAMADLGADRARIRAEHPLDGAVEVAPDMIRRAITNLLTNALRYSDGLIEIASTVQGGALQLSVRDHGPGMTDAQLARAVERFWQADPGHDGAGLGLAVVEEIVELHGGELRLSSPAGGGLRATIRLPLSR